MHKKETIFFDGLGLVEGHFSGVGQYILGILRGFDEIIETSKHQGKHYHRVKVIIPYNTLHRFKSFKFKHIEYVRVPFTFRLMSALWSRNKLPPLDLLLGKGLYVFPRFVSMPLIFSKSAVVIYDISYELHRQYSDERNAIFLSRAVGKSIKRTNKIITISDNAKKEIVDYYKVKSSNVIVATPATDITTLYRRSEVEIKKTKDAYGIKGKYILALSNLEPRKNLGTLVKAYCQLPKEIRNEYALLLVGVSGWKTDKLFNEILDKVKEGYNIIRPSHYVKDTDKAAIISGASMLVYPSHYEGFGMPPLEALACGVPIITANNSSLPEVVGDCGVMLSSDDIDGYTREIENIIKNPPKDILSVGPTHAEQFSWEESSARILKMLEEL